MNYQNLQMTLSDGRTLGYAEYGDPAGYPVFYFHGFPGSRLQAADFHEAAQRGQFRFFGIDRPGMGLSSANKRSSLLFWADDVRELANHLDIVKFSIIAHSGGAPFALACAYVIPELVSSVAIVSGVAPTIMPEAKTGLNRGMRIINVLVRNVPGISWLLMQLHRKMLSKPDMFKKTIQQLPEPDRVILENPVQMKSMIEASTEAFKQGVDGPAREFQLIVKPWGFDLCKIECPVTIFQGKLDSQTPVSHAEIFRSLLPDAELNLFEQEAHLSMLYNHVEEIFESIRP